MAVFSYLLTEKNERDKIKNIKYDKFEIQPYLKSDIFTDTEKSILFNMRAEWIQNVI